MSNLSKRFFEEISKILILAFFNFLKFSFEIFVRISFFLPIKKTVTLYLLTRYLAKTNPSPPLFPVPQKIRILSFLGLSSLIIKSATPFPAFSIKLIVGTPKNSEFMSRTFISFPDIIPKC